MRIIQRAILAAAIIAACVAAFVLLAGATARGGISGGGGGAAAPDPTISGYFLRFGGDPTNVDTDYLLANSAGYQTGVATSAATEAVVPIDGTITAAWIGTQTINSTTVLTLQIDDVSQSPGLYLGSAAQSQWIDGLNYPVTAGERVEVFWDAGTDPNDTTVLLLVTGAASPGSVLPFGADLTTVDRYLVSHGDANQSSQVSGGQHFTRLPVPIAGTITRAAFRQETASAVTYEVFAGGSSKGTFASTAATSGVVTGLSFTVAAGESVELFYTDGTASDATNVILYMEPTDAAETGTVVWLQDATAQRFAVLGGHVQSGGQSIATNAYLIHMRVPQRGAKIRSVAWAKGNASAEAVQIIHGAIDDKRTMSRRYVTAASETGVHDTSGDNIELLHGAFGVYSPVATNAMWGLYIR